MMAIYPCSSAGISAWRWTLGLFMACACLASGLRGEEPPALDEAVATAIAETALDEDEAAFLTERLAGVPVADAETVLAELARHPTFNAAAARREFVRRMPPPEEKYSPQHLAEVKAEADRRFTAFRKGQTITVPITYGAGVSREFSGVYHGLFEPQVSDRAGARNRKVKIGERFFMLEDFPVEVQERFDEVIMRERHRDYLQAEHHQPAKTYEAAFADLLARHLDECRNTYRDDRRQLVRNRLATLTEDADGSAE